MFPTERLNLTYEELQSRVSDFFGGRSTEVFMDEISTAHLQNSCNVKPEQTLVTALHEIKLDRISARDWFALVKETSEFIERLIAAVPVEVSDVC